MKDPESDTISFLRWPRITAYTTARFLVYTVVFTATLVLYGWYTGNLFLKQVVPNAVVMNPVTAICFILVGYSFLSLSGINYSRLVQSTGILTAVVVFTAVAVKLIAWSLKFSSTIDTWLFRLDVIRDNSLMAPSSALCFLLIAGGLISRNTFFFLKIPISQVVALMVGMCALFFFLGYLFAAPEFYGLLKRLPMAVHTSVMFLFMSAATLLINSSTGLTRQFTTPFPAAPFGRMMILGSLAVPILLGTMSVYFYRQTKISAELSINFLVLATIVGLCGIIIYNTFVLNRKELSEKKSEEKFKALLNTAPDAMIVVDTEGTIQLVNDQAEKMFGYASGELIKMKVEHLIPQRFHEAHGNHRQAFQLNPKTRRMGSGFEVFGIRKDRTEFHTEISLSPLFTDNGLLVSAAIRDISLRKKEEERLQFLASISENIHDPIISSDNDFLITRWNDAAEKLFGWTSEEVIGRRGAEILRVDYPTKSREAILDAFSKDGYWQGEVIYHNREGKPVNVLSTASKIRDKNGIVTGNLILVKDITDRKKAEQLIWESQEIFRSLVTNVTDYAILLLDINGHILTWNKGAALMNGYQEKEILGRHISVFYRREDLANEDLSNAIRFAEEKGKFEHEGWRVRKDGTLFWANVTLTPLMDKDGKLTGFAKITRDMTEKKKAQDLQLSFNAKLSRQVADKTKELKETTGQLRQLSAHLQNTREQERRRIARELHDELGQMLTGLRMDVVWLSRKVISTDGAIAERFERALQLLHETRDSMRRISTNLHPSILEDLRIKAALERLTHDFESRSGIATTFEIIPSDLDDTSFSPDLTIGIYRVFQESLNNIAKHAGASRVHASLTLGPSNLLLKIEDNGNGFDMESVAQKGTLGLISMRERAIMMNGSYRIESKPEQGTIVILTVPVVYSG